MVAIQNEGAYIPYDANDDDTDHKSERQSCRYAKGRVDGAIEDEHQHEAAKDNHPTYAGQGDGWNAK